LNCDETGLVDHFERQASVGMAVIPSFQITANEKGQTVTALAGFNAVGTYAPLLFVFKAKRLQASWCVGAPVNSLVKVSDNGWITATLFAEWAESFVKSLPKDDPRPHVLLLDGHSSHIYNLPFILSMKANNIYPFAFPPHCTHVLQPADKSLFKSVKHNWNEDGWQLTKGWGGACLPKTEFFKLFSKVWLKSATVQIAQNGFRSTGLFPLNPGAIPDSVFEPSKTTDRILQPSDVHEGPSLPEASPEHQAPSMVVAPLPNIHQLSPELEEPTREQAMLETAEVASSLPVKKTSDAVTSRAVADISATVNDQSSALGCSVVDISPSPV